MTDAIAGSTGQIIQLYLPAESFSIVETTSSGIELFGKSFPLSVGFNIWKVQVTWTGVGTLSFTGQYSGGTYSQKLTPDIQSLELNRGSQYAFTDISGTMFKPYICLSSDGSSIILKNVVDKTMRTWKCNTASTINVKCFS